MSVYLPSREHTTYVYDFDYKGINYKGTTHQTTRAAALLVEAKRRLEVRQEAAGIRVITPAETPTFTHWAGVTVTYRTRFDRRPDLLARTLRVVLRFWGAKPPVAVGPAAVPRVELGTRPYHNLRLGDVVADARWLERFDRWITARRVSPSTRSSYISACSTLFDCARQPQYRAVTGISSNPFEGIRREASRTRTVTLTPAQILELVAETSRYSGRHIAHALCIGALAPKLRMRSILELAWATHLNADWSLITVTAHKRAGDGQAQVVPVSAALRALLLDIHAGQVPKRSHVIVFRGRPVGGSVKVGLKRAVEALGLKWGSKDGVTFHTLRHSIATLLADPTLVGQLTERLRADVMGHKVLATTQKYTHLQATVQVAPHEALAAALPGLRAAIRPAHVAGSLPGGISGGPSFARSRKPQGNRVVAFPPVEAETEQNRRKA